MLGRDEEDIMRLREVDWCSVKLNSIDLFRLLSWSYTELCIGVEKSSLVFVERELLL